MLDRRFRLILVLMTIFSMIMSMAPMTMAPIVVVVIMMAMVVTIMVVTLIDQLIMDVRFALSVPMCNLYDSIRNGF